MYIVYITTKNRDEALQIGRNLVEDRLAACVNIIDKMHSIYWWEGEIQDDDESVLIAKTSPEKIDALTARVKERHSYTCPCVIAIPVEKGNEDYLNWIYRETNSSK